tara:strand:+ start:151 stop:534 length:384 start_codon:yes stop_codon:yes gene_type:complete
MPLSRKTKTVKMILDLFDKSNNAISVVDVISIFNKKMNKTTVYRILNRLQESGILHSFTDKDGLKRYAKGNQKKDPDNKNDLHSHFLCDDCGVSTCLPLEIPIPKIPDYKINTSQHLLIGQCDNCQN